VLKEILIEVTQTALGSNVVSYLQLTCYRNKSCIGIGYMRLALRRCIPSSF